VATDRRRLTQTPYKTVYCDGFYVLGGFHKRQLFFLSLCIRIPAITRFLVHIDALVLIPSTGFKENFLRFSEPTTNRADARKNRQPRMTRITDAREARPREGFRSWSAATWRRFWEANREWTRIDTNKDGVDNHG